LIYVKAAACGAQGAVLARLALRTCADHRANLPLKMVYRGGRGSHLDDECASHFSDDSGLRSGDLDHRERSDEMVRFVGLDVSVKTTSVCVVDDAGEVTLEQKVPTDPADIIAVSDLAWCVLWPDRDRGWSAITVAGQRVDGG